MPNIANNSPAHAERRFIEDVARLLVPWGVPQTAARLYGFLLLSPEPVSLDRIAAALEVSKSTASVAARLLEMYTLVRRHGERGSRRALYEASDNYEGMLSAQKRMLQAMAKLFQAAARDARPGIPRERLEAMAEFYLAMDKAMDATERRWSARRRS